MTYTQTQLLHPQTPSLLFENARFVACVNPSSSNNNGAIDTSLSVCNHDNSSSGRNSALKAILHDGEHAIDR